MKSADLLDEYWRAALAVDQRHLARLGALGVSLPTINGLYTDIADLPPFGVVQGAVVDGLFIPGDGLPHIVQPIADNGDMLDYVAWRTEAPDDWHLRTGAGTFLGDLDKAVDACLWGEAAHLLSTPLDWLRAGGAGLCVVNWSSPEVLELNRLPSVVVDSAELDGMLRATLSRPSPIPAITISRGLQHAA